MERDKKRIVIKEKKLLLIYNGEEYDSLMLTEKNEKFIIYEISSGFPKRTHVIYYLVQKEDKIDINLN